MVTPDPAPRGRHRYASWLILVALLTSVGAGVAVLNLPTGGLIFAGMTGVMVAATVVQVLPERSDRVRSRWGWMFIGVGAVLCAVAVVGWYLLIQGLVLVLGLVSAALHPVVIAATVSALRRLALCCVSDPADPRVPAADRDSRSAVDHRPRSRPADLVALTDEQLCRGWRISYWELERTCRDRDPRVALRVVELRQAYLDEMDRRHRDGFRSWLRNGARPSSDPTRYLTTKRTGETPPAK